MSNKQVRIFVPATEPWWWWAETLLGRVVKPLIEKYRSDIPYFWFSRYGNILTEDIGDCDFDKISDACKAPISPGEIAFHRSLRFLKIWVKQLWSGIEMIIYVVSTIDGVTAAEVDERDAENLVNSIGSYSSPTYEMVELDVPELKYLQWFRQNADFGPAHEDVVEALHARYTEETGKPIPDGWE